MLILDTQNGPTICLNNATTFGGEIQSFNKKLVGGRLSKVFKAISCASILV